MVLNLSEELRRRNFWTRAANTIFAVLLIAGFGFNCSERWKDKRPMAVQRSLYSYPGQPKRTQETYKNWKAVCLWVRENTHEHSVFLTPARQQTFKWFAERAEVVSWKDVPQDAQSVLEWYQRIQRLYRVELSYPGGLWAYTDEQLLEIAKETGATHLLTLQSDLDARALPPSGFQQIYPANPDTKATFVIFQLEE